MARGARASLSALLVFVAVTGVLSMVPATAHADGTPFPLGTYVQDAGGPPSCPAGFTCNKFTVSACPNVSRSARGNLAVAYPSTGPVRGVITLFSGAGGDEWWAIAPGMAMDFLTKLREQDGFIEVQVRWVNPWLNAPSGEQVGPAVLACRPATVIRHVYDSIYAPLGMDPGPGVCGFCASGNSGGSSQVSYSLSHYGMDSILGAVIPTEGPIHSGIWKGCLRGHRQYQFTSSERDRIDASYGYLQPSTNPGPCQLNDASWTARWQQDAVETGGVDYSHHSTRVEFIKGGQSGGVASSHAADYRDRLLEDPLNHVAWTVVADMPHSVQSSQAGMNALEVALLGSIPVAPPAVTITSGPPAVSSSRTGEFSFTSDQLGTTITCSVDGGVPATCGSPFQVTDASDGPHSLAVQASIGGGIPGPSATWSWTVDTIAPVVAIAAGPASSTKATSARFVFSSDDPEAGLTCAVDGQAPEPCSSPAEVTGLSDGDHEFTVQATDVGGNTGATPWAWTVDGSLSAPEAAITSGPAPQWASGAAAFAFGADDPGATLTCTVDGGPSKVCTSPFTATVAEGIHTFHVYATDSAGNMGPAATWSWTVDTTPPQLVPGGLKMLDVDGNGRVDRINVAFSEPLAAPVIGTAPWILSGTPSAGTLTAVTVFGSVATLDLTEGPGGPDTSVGSFTLALLADPAGIRDQAGNPASFGATAPTDAAPPVRTAVEMFDRAPVDGKVDQVVTTFSEPLEASTSLAPWALWNVPSGGTASAVSVNGAAVTLSLSEGPGGTDTTVGDFVVGLAADAAGVRDASGNLASLQPMAPADRAGPVPVALTDTGGTVNGKIQPGDTLTVTFSEPLLPSSVPASGTVTIADPATASTDFLTITGMTNGALDTGSDGYLIKDERTAGFPASTLTLGNGNRSVTVTVGPTCSASCASLGMGAGPFTFVPAPGLQDASANAAAGTFSFALIRLF